VNDDHRDEMCFWLCTSGSTGQPKAAVHVHAAPQLTDYCYGAHVLGLTENDVVYSVSKLFFAYGLSNAMSFPLLAGATTVLTAERPTPNSVAELLRTYGVTVFFAVPTFYAAFLAANTEPLEGVFGLVVQRPPGPFGDFGVCELDQDFLDRGCV
jgi:acyl-coenzyme A synthetase/AMP-(fatty) acid ligase